jgi:hypothetical protein
VGARVGDKVLPPFNVSHAHLPTKRNLPFGAAHNHLHLFFFLIFLSRVFQRYLDYYDHNHLFKVF